MKLPFNTRQFLDVFKSYNQAIWPLQLVFILLAVITVCLVIWKPIISGKIIPCILALLWMWMGGVYHLVFFSTINEAANIFGLLFILQGILFLRYAIIKSPAFELKKDIDGIAATALIIYSLVAYPAIGYYSGHGYPYSPTFGLPCPTTIFTFGLLLMTRKNCPVSILIIPFIWSVFGFSAAFHFGIVEDIWLLFSGLLTTSIFLFRNKLNTIICNILIQILLSH